MENLLPAVVHAGGAIMEIYETMPKASEKADGSPVTEADKAAEKIVLDAIKENAPDITIISEENTQSHSLTPPDKFFLVDPLDGTREFLKRDGKGNFTVNIGLIENGMPTFGIVYVPAIKRMFTGIVGKGAEENGQSIKANSAGSDRCIAVASASHRDPMTDQWLKDNDITETVSIGSSVKFCLIASGEADIYPRFGPTMEWDTAAGHAVLLAAGGQMTNPDGTPFLYGKAEYRNGNFIASGLANSNA